MTTRKLPRLTPEEKDLLDQSNQVIEVIKRYRARTGTSLADAKAVVDMWRYEHEEPQPVVKVRVLVGVDEEGNWFAIGSPNHTKTDHVTEIQNCEVPLSENVKYTWLEAYVHGPLAIEVVDDVAVQPMEDEDQ